MDTKERMLSTLLASIAGILIFISTAHWIDLNGYTNYAPFIILFGLALLFFPKPFQDQLKPLGFFSKHLLLTLGHICVFIGTKVYLFDRFIDHYWII